MVKKDMHKLPARNAILVGFDMDGVLIDHTQTKIAVASRFGMPLTPRETSSDKMRDTVPDDIRRNIQEIIYDDAVISKRSPMMPGAVAVLAELSAKKIPFVLVSRRKNPDWAQTLLKYHGLWPEYFRADNVFFVGNPEDKNTVARRLGITHYIDDEVRVLECLSSVRHRYLFDVSGMREESPDYTRISSLAEFMKNILITN